MASRIVLYSPDRAIIYDGRTPDEIGVGGGITARLSLAAALAAAGHDVTAYVNCRERIQHAGVRYVPLADLRAIEADALIAISTGGDLSFAPIGGVEIDAHRRVVWVQGVPKPAALEALGADLVCVASEFLRGVVVERWAVDPRRVFVSYNGLQQARFEAAARRPIARDEYGLCYIGPPEKGLAAAIDVLRRLRAHDSRYHLDVFGGGRLWGRPDEAPAADVEPGVRHIGLVGQAALVPRLFEYEFCLAPQAMEEGFGIAVQEARRAGQIAIASRVGAFAELIRSGVDGFLVDDPHTSADSADWMSDIVLTLARAPEQRAALRRQAMAAASVFSWTRAADEWAAALSRGTAEPDALPAASAGNVVTVLFAGYFGRGNTGDEAILQATLSELRRWSAPVRPIVVSGDPFDTYLRYRVETVHERDLAGTARAIERADVVVLGGGGLLHDHFGVDESSMLSPAQWGLASHAALAVQAWRAGKPFVMAGIGAGPLTTEAGRRLTRLLVERSSLIWVRDEGSQALLQSLGGPTREIDVGADLAFLYDDVSQSDPPMGLIAVAVRAWAGNAWMPALAAALDRLVVERQAKVLLFPFQSVSGGPLTDDIAAAEALRALMREREAATVGSGDADVPDIRQAIVGCDVMIAMRLHAAILAVGLGVPVVALGYDEKVRGVMAGLGRGESVLDLESLTADRILEAVGAAARPTPWALRTVIGSARASLARVIDAARAGTLVIPEASEEWRALVADHRQRQSPPAVAPAAGWRKRWLVDPISRLVRPHLIDGPSATLATFARARREKYVESFEGLRAPGTSGLVSVVLPVHNGGAWLGESVDSVLRQTWTRFELIIVNDGSTDETARIADAYAARDARVRVVHQAQARLPRALSRGFEETRGEFLTWTSADNRMRPRCLERLVTCLERHPAWDMAYANLDLVGEDGAPLRGSTFYEGSQRPSGSEHVHLPPAPGGLNVVADNFVGAAFLYRIRVAALLGDYSPRRFVMEDYDYWMRVNAVMTLRHADFDTRVYEYRVHGRSLTARWDELDMFARRDRLMVWDDARRDTWLQPMVWVVDDAHAPALGAALRARLAESGHCVHDDRFDLSSLPRWSVPVVLARVTTRPTSADRPPLHLLPPGTTCVLVAEAERLPERMDARWDACVAFGMANVLPRLRGGVTGWLAAADTRTLVSAIDVRVKSACLSRLEEVAERDDRPTVKVSIVICARGPGARLDATLAAVAAQSFFFDREVIVVDNRAAPAMDVGDRARVITCPLPGLSAARNAGLAEARGEIVCFLDDDAVPEPEWLRHIVTAFDAHPGTGIVGGAIRLETPAVVPAAVRSGWRKYWSEFVPEAEEYFEVGEWGRFPWGANWAARRSVLRTIGGFRTGYGRTGDDYWGGEEIVAACLAQRLGHAVAIEPRAVVRHHVDPARFTFRHVYRTIVSGALVRHRAERDGYAPRANSIVALVRRLVLEHGDPAMRGDRLRWLDTIFLKAAQIRLIAAEIADLARRVKKTHAGHGFS